MSQLAPAPKFAATYVNVSGQVVPAVGYKLYTYIAGTSTPKASYTDYTLGTANANPVVMNARGECDLWLDGNYKFVLTTDADVTVWTVDEVRDLTSSQTLSNMTLAGTLTVTSTAVTWSGNPTHSGNHTWSGNQVFNGNVTIGDSSADTLTITPSSITWSNSPTHSGNHTFSGALAVSTGAILSSTYTPTATALTGITSIAAYGGHYSRVGDAVTCGVVLEIDPSSAGIDCSCGVSLPIASDFIGTINCTGTGGSFDGITVGVVIADATNNRATFKFVSGLATSQPYFLTFFYRIL